ncbi:hypothetical protein K0C01_12470 [Salinarchaeum sp. IM2453]|uniref:DUF7547 family protein n=1 Tax=Salinarchaeum sp. IM2453 TaxID=2862870 RepID=UPI001C837345|nr:hypothetical protein [Salinarchaeum sp. IM2453]QZA88576.1 hypothetical protein K0C01_12470 [Salinarchaeum sp. IM2453]
MSDRDDADLANTAAELEQSMRELQADLEEDLPRGPLGFPRLPSPGEVLRYADEAVIPAIIAILEANIKILEAIQKAIRLANTGQTVQRESKAAVDRASRVGQETVERFDSALTDLQTMVEQGKLPENEAAREILEEAQDLRDELRKQTETARDETDETLSENKSALEAPEDEDEEDPDEVTIDIDSELESIMQEYDLEEDDDDELQSDGSDDGSDDDNEDES